MVSLAPDTVLHRGPVLWRRSGDQVIVRRRGHDRLIVLSGTGFALWEAIAEPIAFESLAAALARAHDAPFDTVAADLQVALESLIADGIVALS